MSYQTITLDQDITAALNSAKAEGDGVKLPFTYALLWWKHGNIDMKPLGNVLYFGGWVSAAEEFHRLIGEFNASPDNFVNATYNGNEGEFAVYHSRTITVAPIATRVRWLKSEDGKKRSHMQKLCMMAIEEDGKIKPWGPALLTCKGLTTRELENEMRRFETATFNIREKVAPTVPALYFWRSVGTFGDKAKFMSVGKGNASSTVTYPSVYKPEEITEEHVHSWFVGQETAQRMADLSKQAEEWVNDKTWKGEAPALEPAPALQNNTSDQEYDPDKAVKELGY